VYPAVRTLFNSLIAILIPISSGLVGCVRSMQPVEPVSVPVVFQSVFQSCDQSDGEASLRVRELNNSGFSAMIIWKFLPQSVAEVQLNSMLGDSLMEIKRRGRNWAASGAYSFKISESDSGVLAIDGNELPLLSEEISCVLAGFWPANWLSSLRVSEQRSAFLRLVGHEALRDVDVWLTLTKSAHSSESTDIKSCAVLRWGGVLGFFRKESTICRERMADSIVMRLDGVGRYKVEWTIHDET
jgi:hypothetical protein